MQPRAPLKTYCMAAQVHTNNVFLNMRFASGNSLLYVELSTSQTKRLTVKLFLGATLLHVLPLPPNAMSNTAAPSSTRPAPRYMLARPGVSAWL